MRGLTPTLLLTIAALTGELRANLINYEFSGTITGFRCAGIADSGINVGDAFRLSLSIDTGAQNLGSGSVGRYLMPSLFTFTTTDKQFGAGGEQPMTTWTQHGPALGMQDQLVLSYLGFVTLPWSGLAGGNAWSSLDVLLQNNAGTALASDAIPNAINIADWADSHSLHLGGGSGSLFYEINADIDSIKPVPESSDTALLLSLAFVPLLALYSLKRRTRQV